MIGILLHMHTLSPSCLSTNGRVHWIKWTLLHFTTDALVLQHGRVRFSSWTCPLKSLDASAVLGGRVLFELHLRPSKIWMRPASAIDALGFFVKRVQQRLCCVYHFCGRIQKGRGELVCNRYCSTCSILQRHTVFCLKQMKSFSHRG